MSDYTIRYLTIPVKFLNWFFPQLKPVHREVWSYLYTIYLHSKWNLPRKAINGYFYVHVTRQYILNGLGNLGFNTPRHLSRVISDLKDCGSIYVHYEKKPGTSFNTGYWISIPPHIVLGVKSAARAPSRAYNTLSETKMSPDKNVSGPRDKNVSEVGDKNVSERVIKSNKEKDKTRSRSSKNRQNPENNPIPAGYQVDEKGNFYREDEDGYRFYVK